jgi:hypothetical protein
MSRPTVTDGRMDEIRSTLLLVPRVTASGVIAGLWDGLTFQGL